MINTFATTENYDLSVLDSIFNTPATPDVLESPSAKVLVNNTLDKVFDAAVEPVTVTKVPETTISPVVTEKGTLEILDSVTNEFVTEKDVPTSVTEPIVDPTAGRPKTDKDAIIEYLITKVEAQEFGVPEDYDTKIPLKDYLSKLPTKDIYNILDTNRTVRENELRDQAPIDFYNALPPEAKAVAEFAAKNGPKDWPAFFSSLARTEQVRQFDIKNEDHHAPIVGTYLAQTTQLTPAQINEQIEEWKENGKLDKKAAEFKAPLDALQQQYTNQLIQQAAAEEQKQLEIANFYAHNVSEALNKNELAGIKLDKKFVSELRNGLVTTVPGPWSGQPVNLLGHVIEQHSFIQPNYETLALMTWMGLDKEGCIAAIQQYGTNMATEKAVKLIKLNQGITASTQTSAPEPQKQVKRLPDQSKVFKRV